MPKKVLIVDDDPDVRLFNSSVVQELDHIPLEAMFFYTDTADSPWTIIKSNDKKRARLNCMRHFLSCLPYPGKDNRVVRAPNSLLVGSGGDVIGRSDHVLGSSLHPDQRKSS